MPLAARISRAVVVGLPLAFVVVSWLASAGFPYFLDSNETFLSYLHARNLEVWDPWRYAWMTAETTDVTQPESGGFYTHNPNGPRYLHYILLKAGIRELPAQVLVLSVTGTLLATTLLWRTFGRPGLLVVPLAVAMDYTGFLSWTVNTYRIWSFVLFFGLTLAVMRRRTVWLGVLTFLLFQVEYGFAFFAAVSAATLAMMTHRRAALAQLLVMAAGAALSVGLFGMQVLTFYGWDGFLHELAATYARRGTAGAENGLGRYLFQAWHGPALLLSMIARDTHSPIVLVLVLWGLLASVFSLRRPHLDEARRLLARLTLSVMAGIVATASALYGYFVDGFVVSLLPLATFLVAPALGLVALELRAMLGHVVKSRHVGTLAAALVLAPMLAASATHFRPPVAVDLFGLLQHEFRGRTIVGPTLGPWHANPELAFALAGGRTFRTSDVEATPDDLRRFESVRDTDGSLTYLCLDTLYIRKLAALGELSKCETAASRLTARGHAVLAEGFGWTLVGLSREDRPPSADGMEGHDGDR